VGDDVGVVVFIGGEEEAQGEAAGVAVGVCVGDVLGIVVSSTCSEEMFAVCALCLLVGQRLTGRPVEEEKRARRGMLGEVK
jgi:hypothetical protein